MPARALARRRRARRADPREPAADGATPTRPIRTTWRRTVRRSGRSTTTRSCSTASRSRWSSPKTAETARFAAIAGARRIRDRAPRHGPARTRQSPRPIVVKKPAEAARRCRQGLAAAAVRHEAEYFIPTEHHNPMELFASTVVWDGDGKLTVYDKTQGVQNVQHYLCGVFGLKPDDVRVMSPFVGGAFGSGLRPQYPGRAGGAGGAGAQALGARRADARSRCTGSATGRRRSSASRSAPMPTARSTRSPMRRSTMTSQYEDFSRNDTGWSGAALQVRQREIRAPAGQARSADARPTCARRAPPPACIALECAMDELAVALKLDPMELRLRCYSDRDQNEDKPFSSKQLRECYRQGAEAFGWNKRNPEPRSMRDGSDLVGWGMATGVWEALQVPITVRIVLTANGHAEVSCATSDIGTGTYTIMAQVAADMLGLPIDNISVKLGDSSLPQSPVEGGSWIAASVAHGDRDHGRRDPRGVAALRAGRCRTRRSPALQPDDVVLADGKIVSKQRCRRARVSIADAMRHGKVDRIEQEKTTNSERRPLTREQHPFGAFRRGEGRRAARHRPRHARRQRGRGRAHPQHQDRAQPDHGRRGVGHRHGAARGNADRPPVRPHHERQHRRVSRAGECRRPRHQGDLRRRAGRPQSIRSASRASARSASSASRRRSPTRSITPPASACAICRSRWTS